MSGCAEKMSWSVKIEAIPPSAPGWDTGLGEEERKCEVLLFYQCDKCGRKFKHKKTLKRHNTKMLNCNQNWLNISANRFADFGKFCKTISNQQTEVTTGGDQTAFCQICLAHFVTPDKGQIHREEYSKIFQCCNCKKSSSQNSYKRETIPLQLLWTNIFRVHHFKETLAYSWT